MKNLFYASLISACLVIVLIPGCACAAEPAPEKASGLFQKADRRLQELKNYFKTDDVEVKAQTPHENRRFLGGKAGNQGFVAAFIDETLDPRFGRNGVKVFNDQSVSRGVTSPSKSREVVGIDVKKDGSIVIRETRTFDNGELAHWGYSIAANGDLKGYTPPLQQRPVSAAAPKAPGKMPVKPSRLKSSSLDVIEEE